MLFLRRDFMYIQIRNRKYFFMSENKSVASPDSKSALSDKNLYIDTYGRQMNVADSKVGCILFQFTLCI